VKALHTRQWVPEVGSPRAVVYLVHGLGEHSGRYERLAGRFVKAGFAVSALDLRGHGESPGHKGDTRFAPALEDIDGLLADGAERWPGAPAFLYGHSLGALLAVLYLMDHPAQLPAGAVVSAIGVHSALREQRVKVAAARLLGRWTPHVRVKAGIDPAVLSRDEAVVDAYRRDPLVHGFASMGFGRDAIEAIDTVLGGKPNPDVPLLLIHGGEDKLAYASGARELAAAWPDVTDLRVYDGLFHEVHNDPEQKQVFTDVRRWMEERLPRSPV
jgi:alpha-beta hydrolase superfamily lysophospholipase